MSEDHPLKRHEDREQSFSAVFLAQRNLPAIVEEFKRSPSVGGSITAHRVVPAKAAETAPFPDWLRSELVSTMEARGVTSLYGHQRLALDAVHTGRDVALVTPTASGKSLCYHLPVLHRIMEEPETRALYLFPTKALSQDQYNEVHDLIDAAGADIRTYTFDGDTPADARQAVRDHGHIVVSNPDMLHTGILPHHTKWTKLFRNLRYVVLDEVHTYRGVFGSHVANVIRRLKRIAEFHGAHPTFICCSATIANPKEHVEAIIERPVEVVERSGAPTGEKHVLFYNPPVVNQQLGIRASYLHATRRFAEELIARGAPTIVFALSRLNVEVLLGYLRNAMRQRHMDPELVQGYRGGYLPKHRRRIEKGLRDGTIRGVVATNALELGIDIGHLSAAIIAGYPGSVASLWQQSGRAGRRNAHAVTIFVARSSPLDQYIVEHPDYFFAQSPEHARTHPDNLFVAVDHVRCAAFELPFQEGEAFGDIPGEEVDAILSHLASHGVVQKSGGRTHWMSQTYPANAVSLRRVHSENFVVIDTTRDRIVAEVDFESAQTTLHEHAIYTVDGQPHEVERLDYENHKAYVRPVKPDYFTDAMTYSRVAVLEVEDERRGAEAGVEQGEVSVTRKVVGFKKIKLYTHENVGYGEINLSEVTLHTTSYWTTVPWTLLNRLPFSPSERIDSLVGVAYVLHHVAALKVMCEPRDLGRAVGDKSARWYLGSAGPGEGNYRFRPADEDSPEVPAEQFDPTIFIYESIPGGVGFSGKLFERNAELLAAARDIVNDCSCEAGCPSCIGAMPNPSPPIKAAAQAVLEALIADCAGGPAA